MMYKATVGRKKFAQPSGVDAEGYLLIEGTRLWKWRALDAELRVAQAELESVSQHLQVEIAKHPEISALLQRKAALAGTISSAKTELLNVQQEIEVYLGVPLKTCSFDDKTGRVYNLGHDGAIGEPIKARKQPRGRRALS
jgi:hypothetical protein